MKRPVVERPKAVSPTGSFLSDDAVVAKMFCSKNGTDIRALWEGTLPKSKSHSEADMSLCMHLAFYCGGDEAQMDRLFRESGLMRDKWDRVQSGSTYGAITIKKAITQCATFYTPVQIDAVADFNNIAIKLSELDVLNNRRYRSGDIGYGRLFADIFKDVARYVPERKKWFIYDGKRWNADVASLAVMELGKDLADALLIYTATIKDEEKRTVFLKSSKTWQPEKVPGKQTICIHWNFIGAVDVPDVQEKEKTA